MIFEHYLKLKKDRFNIAITYVMIVYLAVGIYMYTAYSLNVSFIASFTQFNISFDTSGNLTDMYRIGLVLGFFSGLMAGQLSANSILSGFKHAVLLVLACFIPVRLCNPIPAGSTHNCRCCCGKLQRPEPGYEEGFSGLIRYQRGVIDSSRFDRYTHGNN